MSALDIMAMPTRNHHKELKKFCEPVKQFFGITSLAYIEIYNNSNIFNLHTHPDWLDHCIDKKYYIDDPHMVSPDNIGSGFKILSSGVDDDFLNGMCEDGSNNFDMWHGFSYIEKNENSYRVYAFDSPKENYKVYTKIINNIDYMKKYIGYLSKQLEQYKRKFSDNLANFSEIKGDAYYEQQGLIVPEEIKIEQYKFLKQLGLVESSFDNINLTAREKQCINLYLEGHSATQTAKILSLSPRTVESHIANIKSKLNLTLKRELFDKANILKELSII